MSNRPGRPYPDGVIRCAKPYRYAAGMAKTEQTIGPWRVIATWDQAKSQTGPVRLVIEPAPGADPVAVAAGISSTVLRDVHPIRPETPETLMPSAEVVKGLAAKARELSANGVTDEYLAALAALYVQVAPQSRAPGVEIGELIGKAPSTVKNHLVQARRRGFLTTVPHRRGGTLTPSGRRLLGS